MDKYISEVNEPQSLVEKYKIINLLKWFFLNYIIKMIALEDSHLFWHNLLYS